MWSSLGRQLGAIGPMSVIEFAPLVAFMAVTGVDECLNPGWFSSLRRMLQDV